MFRTTRHRGLTLIELIVVVGILAVLIAVMLPALISARKNARAIQCAGVPVSRRTRTMGAGGQPALGPDHGTVAVAQLAHRVDTPVARWARAPADDR
jgi:prepilin-type N-terminal cleavage/methylation domain-containing protein